MKWAMIFVLLIFAIADGYDIIALRERVAALEAQLSANPNTIGD